MTANSILDDVKHACGLLPDYTAFDQDIILFTNGVLSTLNQLGIGPEDGIMISDSSVTWDSLLNDNKKLNNVKNYVYLRVRILFDPPSTSFVLDAFKQQITELEWRLNVEREGTSWIDPNPVTPRYPLIIDGGDDSSD